MIEHTTAKPRSVPAHYGTIRGFMRHSLKSYLASVETTMRVLAACLISGILFTTLWAVLNALLHFVHLLHLVPDRGGTDLVIPVIMLLLAPPILRAGVLGGRLQTGKKESARTQERSGSDV